MARVGPTINSVYTTLGEILYATKETLKSAAWTCEGSSDGTTYNPTGDQITSAGTGAGGFQRARAWWRGRDPAGRREVIFQNVVIGALNATGSWRMKMSESTRFTAGSPNATTVPATVAVTGDEQVLAGSGTDAAPVGINWGGTGSSRLQIVAESAPISGVYAFQVNSLNPGVATQAPGQIFCEPLAPGSYDGADQAPCIWYAASTIFAGTGGQGWIAYGTGAQAWATNLVLNAGIFTGALGPDPVNGRDVNGLQGWSNILAAVNRSRGYSTCLACKGPARPYPATTNIASALSFYYLGNYAFMYPTNQAPVP